ncbi:MAG: S9 family peptidase, partial [Candidatus Aminicenantes bacterium]|nr:S9 family peptidase [Candidatus Aminicenantes bacterium]
MNKIRNYFIIILAVIFIGGAAWPGTTEEPLPVKSPAAVEKPAELKSIEMEDILAWKNIRLPIVSNDGRWFAYRLTPNKGESELIARSTASEKEYKFRVGEVPTSGSRGGSSRGEIEFSEDSKWLAFKIYPDEKELKKLKKEKKEAANKAGLLNLETGEKKEFDRVQRFSFSNKNPGWLALHKYRAEGLDEKSKWKGTDLVLVELASGRKYNIGNVSEFAFNKAGDRLVWLIDAADKSGNSVVLRLLKTGQTQSLDSGKFVYKGLTWTEKGDAFAVVKGEENKDFEEELYQVLGFKDLDKNSPVKVVYDPLKDKTFPQ